MDIQRVIGGDIIMAFDECPPGGSEYQYAKLPWNLHIAGWTVVFSSSTPRLISMAIHKIFSRLWQGGVHHDLRKASCEYIASKNATGNAIGGLSVGEPIEKMYEICSLCCDELPPEQTPLPDGIGHAMEYS